jgi:putative ABC transport system permease protein
VVNVQKMIQNLRYGMRMLRKNPGLTAAVIATLAIGIGATTAIYTVVYATLLAPLPFPQPDQLVIVWSKVRGHNNSMSAGDFLDWQKQNRTFDHMSAFTGGTFNVAEKGQPELINGRRATPGLYNMLGTPFLLGRDFLPEEGVPGKDHVVIMTNKLWNKLGANRDIIGHTMRINGQPYTVVGVLSAGVTDRSDAQLIAPLAFTPEQINHDYHWLLTIGRLKPGVTMQQAQADMDGVTSNIAAAYPKTNKGWGAGVEAFKNDFLPSDRIHNLWLLLGAVGFVLLIACVNIANLLLAKGASRQKEIAIRGSMGAGRGQVFVQFLTESLVLAMVGGGLGIALGAALLRGIVALMPQGTLPDEANLQLDPAVLAVALGVTTLAGLLFGCAPAWYASRVDPAESLKDGGRSGMSSASHKLRRGLIVGEFSLALALLAGAGLAIHSFWNLTQIDLGVRPDHVLTFSLEQPQGRFENRDQMNEYNQQILRAVSAVPGVSETATVTGLPLRGTSDGMPFTLVGGPTYADPSQRPGAGFQSVSPGYFKTFGIGVLKGRSFNEQDTATSLHVAMVNEEFVRQHLKGLNPIGQRLSIEEIIPGLPKLGPAIQWEIVGVFHNVRAGDFRDDFPEIDVPFTQSLSPNVNIGVRTAEDPATMVKAIAAAVHLVDSQIALGHVRTMDEVKSQSLADDRFTMFLYACFAVVALALAAVGIYGLMAFAVSQRTQEIGLRIALGASRQNVMSLIIREGSLLALIGLGIGVGGAVLVGRTMRATLYGVGTLDISVILSVAMLLFLTAMFASYLPARRAASIDPMAALRTD